MKRKLALAAGLAGLLAAPALAEETGFNEDAVAAMKGDIVIESPYAISMKDDEIVVFMTVHNSAESDDTIEAVTSEAANKAALAKYEGFGEDRKTETLETIAAPANEAVLLEQNGYHVVLTDLKEPVKGGDVIPLTLSFAETGEMEVQVSVAVMN